jgi:large subunit ribosomal protein L1
MAAISKRRQLFQSKMVAGKQYPIADAIALVKESATAKFKESFDVAIKLGVDTRKSDQSVRSAIVLPHGTGREVRVAVFADGENAEKARAAGADIVGLEDLVESVKKGRIDFQIAIATPASMQIVSQIGQILGPRGLMPNPKVGTVTNDVAAAVKNVKSGQILYRADKYGIVHCTVGKADFSAQNLKENIEALLASLRKAKPSAAKGMYIKKLVVSSTMGLGVTVDLASVAA